MPDKRYMVSLDQRRPARDAIVDLFQVVLALVCQRPVKSTVQRRRRFRCQREPIANQFG